MTYTRKGFPLRLFHIHHKIFVIMLHLLPTIRIQYSPETSSLLPFTSFDQAVRRFLCLVLQLLGCAFPHAIRSSATDLHLKCAVPIYTLHIVVGSYVPCSRSLVDMFPVHRPAHI